MNAADKILRKALVTSGLDTKGWSQIQAGLRDRAFFSSRITNLRIVDAMRRNVEQLVKGGKSESEVRRDLREYLGSIGYDADKDLKPGEKSRRGTIKDLMTKSRLDVMMKTNADQARGYASHIRATTTGAILAFPAYELVRVERRKLQRNWDARWKSAAEEVGWEGVARNGAKIALKTSPIWMKLSRFGNPFPPFDFNSGMGVRDVKKSVCREIGLLGEEEQPKIPETPDFNENLSAGFPAGHWSGEYANFLHENFGDQLQYIQDQKTGDVTVRWNRSVLHDMFERPEEYAEGGGWRLGKATHKLLSECDKVNPELRKIVEGRGLTIDDSIVKHTIADGHWLVDKRKGNMPVTHGDLDLVPSLWRSPDHVERGKDNDSLVACIETVDGGVLKMPIHRNGIVPFGTGLYKTKNPKASIASIP